MSELKVSEAASLASADEIENFYFNKVEAGTFVQKAINSELDRIAGPLVEALKDMPCICDKPIGVPEHGRLCPARISDEALANYRKERGE